MYKGKRLAIKSKEGTQQIIHDIHEGIGDSCKSKATGKKLNIPKMCGKTFLA